MSSSKSRSAPSKIVGRVSRGSPDSGSNSTHSKTSSDKSARLVDRKSSKVTTTATATNNNNRSNHLNSSTVSEKRAVTKGSVLHEQLGQAQVDLKKAKDQLAMAEDAKSRALEELREMKKMAEEANLRLSEVLSKQKHVQEDSEMAKPRDDEQRASIMSVQKKEQAWQLELEELQKQQSLDSAALLATKQDLERATKELSVALEAKAFALNQAEEARKMADANAKRIQDLSVELAFLTESRESASDSRTAAEKGKERKGEPETVTLLENLKLELISLRDSESQARSSLRESKERIEMLEEEIEISKKSESKVIESMISLTEQLEDTKMSLQDANLEISSLKEKMEALEASGSRGSKGLEVSYHHLEKGNIDLHNMGETIEILKLELEKSRNDLLHAREGEFLAVSNMQALAEEASSLRNELRLATEAEEKSKKALDDLAVVLHEVTNEGNRVKAELESIQKESESLKVEQQLYKSTTSNSEDEVQVELNEARKEIDRLMGVIERARLDAEDSTSSWNAKEMGFINCIKMSEEEIAAEKEENQKLIVSLREAKEGARIAEIEKCKLMDSVRQAEVEASAARQAFEVVNVENSRLRNALSEVERELVSVIHENDYLKESEAAARQNVDKLMKLLDAATVEDSNRSCSLPSKINHELPHSEIRLLEDCGIEGASKMKSKGAAEYPKTSAKGLHDSRHIEVPSADVKTYSARPLSISPNENSKNKELVLDPHDPDDISEIDDFEPQYESIDKMSDLSPNRTDDGETLNFDDYDHVTCSQLEEMDENKVPPAIQKKKKALLRRFGDMLKKKGKS
ncbi:WEB family protein At5g16730, chloroplastic-like [Nymphaea colorata]|nr:WEB family protein At5g16730, chloroplastic-like [Nymphaea colorata]